MTNTDIPHGFKPIMHMPPEPIAAQARTTDCGPQTPGEIASELGDIWGQPYGPNATIIEFGRVLVTREQAERAKRHGWRESGMDGNGSGLVVIVRPPRSNMVQGESEHTFRRVPRIVLGDVANGDGDLWADKGDGTVFPLRHGILWVTEQQADAALRHGWRREPGRGPKGALIAITRSASMEHDFVQAEGEAAACCRCGMPMPPPEHAVGLCPGRRPAAPSEGEELGRTAIDEARDGAIAGMALGLGDDVERTYAAGVAKGIERLSNAIVERNACEAVFGDVVNEFGDVYPGNEWGVPIQDGHLTVSGYQAVAASRFGWRVIATERSERSLVQIVRSAEERTVSAVDRGVAAESLRDKFGEDASEAKYVQAAARLRADLDVAFAPLAKVIERAKRIGFDVQFGVEVKDGEASMADLVLLRSY